MTLELCMQHWWLKPDQISTNDDLGWPSPFYSKVKFGHLGFCMGKKWNNGFFWFFCSLWHQCWFMQSVLLVYTLEGTVFIPSSWYLVRMFIFIKTRPSLKLGHVRSKTRSLGQILEKPCVYNCGFIFHWIFVKLCQNVCLNNTEVKFKYGSC